jgi:hypothetical protein
MQTGQQGVERGYEMQLGNIERQSDLLGKQYDMGIGNIEAQEQQQQQGFGNRMAMDALGLGQRKQDWAESQPGKPMFTPTQLIKQGRDAATDARREQTQMQKDTLVEANQITRSIFGMEFVINSIQDLDEAIYSIENQKIQPSKVGFGQAYPPSLTVLPQLKQLRDQYYGTETPMMPMGGGQTGKPPDMTDAEWQEYLQMKGQ